MGRRRGHSYFVFYNWYVCRKRGHPSFVFWNWVVPRSFRSLVSIVDYWLSHLEWDDHHPHYSYYYHYYFMKEAIRLSFISCHFGFIHKLTDSVIYTRTTDSPNHLHPCNCNIKNKCYFTYLFGGCQPNYRCFHNR